MNPWGVLIGLLLFAIFTGPKGHLRAWWAWRRRRPQIRCYHGDWARFRRDLYAWMGEKP